MFYGQYPLNPPSRLTATSSEPSSTRSPATGAAPSVTCCPGVLETRIYNRLGIPAVGFGPGLIERMHSPDEDVPVGNLIDATNVYAGVAAAIAHS